MNNQNDRTRLDDSAAFQFMTLDILENILQYSDNPGQLGKYLTQQIRELIGGRVITLVQCIHGLKGSKHRVISIHPKRYENSTVNDHIKSLALACHEITEPTVWQPDAIPPGVAEILSALECQSSIAIPLNVGTTRVGVLLILELFDIYAMDKVLHVLEPLSSVTALILRNALLYENQEAVITARTLQLSIRNQITNVFLTTPDHEMYTELLKIILEYTESEIGVFGYLDEQDGLVAPTMSWAVWDQCQVPDKSTIFPRDAWGDSAWPQAIREKRAIYSNEASKEIPEGHMEIHRHISLPVIYQDAVVGLIQIANKGTKYTDRDVNLLEEIATHIAPILNARLQRDRIEDERRQATETIQKQLDELERSRQALLGILEDAKQAELALKDSEAKYIDLYDNAPDMYVSVDAKTALVTQCNQTLARNLGYSREEIIGHPIFDLYHPDCMQEVQKAFQQFVESGEIHDKELILMRKDGSKLDVSLNVSAVRDEDGNILHSRSTWRDITERKQTEGELQKHRLHLEELVADRTAELNAINKELEAFSYSVSHDLRAPLRTMDGFSQAVIEDYGDQLDDEGKDYLRRIRRASQHMAQLIDDILQLSRISRAEMHTEAVELSKLVRSIADTLQQSQSERQVEFAIEDGIVVQGDKRLLAIALENLLSNAWKFTANKPKGMIEFGITEYDKDIVYYVRDNGAGFDIKHAEKLFTPFQRLHSDEDYPGTGIGLSTVQRIIRRHSGNIWAEAEPGQGATFYFTL